MTDRTPTDFALEFAEYMAKGAEAVIAAVCKQQLLQQQFEEGEGPDPLTMQDADEGVSEYMRGLTADIYEFRKRRDRAALSAPAPRPLAWLRICNISNLPTGVFLTSDIELRTERLAPLYAAPSPQEQT